MFRSLVIFFSFLSFCLLSTAQTASENTIEEIIVNTDYRQSNLDEIPSSLIVMEENLIQKRMRSTSKIFYSTHLTLIFLQVHLVHVSIKLEVLESEANFRSRLIRPWGSSLMASTLAVLAMRPCSMTLSK